MSWASASVSLASKPYLLQHIPGSKIKEKNKPDVDDNYHPHHHHHHHVQASKLFFNEESWPSFRRIWTVFFSSRTIAAAAFFSTFLSPLPLNQWENPKTERESIWFVIDSNILSPWKSCKALDERKNKSKTEPNWLDIVMRMCFCLFDLQKWFELTSSSLLCGWQEWQSRMHPVLLAPWFHTAPS